jgi:hypothetical protein
MQNVLCSWKAGMQVEAETEIAVILLDACITLSYIKKLVLGRMNEKCSLLISSQTNSQQVFHHADWRNLG